MNPTRISQKCVRVNQELFLFLTKKQYAKLSNLVVQSMPKLQSLANLIESLTFILTVRAISKLPNLTNLSSIGGTVIAEVDG